MEIVLISHSNLALGMKDTVEFIMGKQKKLHAIAAYVDDSKELKDQLDELVLDFDTEPVLFITDLSGGSVNSFVSKYICNKEQYYLITGMNLALVLEILTINYENKRNEILQQLVNTVDSASKGLSVIDIQNMIVDEEEDF